MFMLFGLRAYARSAKPTFETCTVFGYLAVPQLVVCLFVCIFDSGHSGCCIGYMALCIGFGLCCKVSGEMIIEGKKKHYRQGQACSAGVKMYTDIFTVIGELVFESFQKSSKTNEIQVTFN